jgi:NAD(P)-dependent dehydrogenase (short-subunit alcohol dehydrogenase family)
MPLGREFDIKQQANRQTSTSETRTRTAAKMVGIEIIKASNAKVASLPSFVALFIGATQGIGEATLQHLTQNAPSSSRIYTVARPSSLAKHQEDIAALRKQNPSGTYEVIEADVSLISEVDKIVAAIKKKETKLDLLVLSAGFLAFDGLKPTSEGLDPAMVTGYFSRLRSIQQLIPLLNAAPAPRILSILAAGREAPLKEDDFALQAPGNWSTWQSAIHGTTMGTLSMERFARQNPGLSIVHWYPGPVDTAALARAKASGMVNPSADETLSKDESGARGLFYATSDRYAVKPGLVPALGGVEAAKKSGGGIFQLDPLGEYTDSEAVLSELRGRGVDETIWKFTEGIFAKATSGGA